ncbi:13074_t:CDS:2 [Entrophospora sp. SA101]|nr:1239_t:CDS:2 [Entrophospora sp. SA101]CAJ0759350.1 13074_t:CDS:2 [Entrophospora sp. SA101]CAJ0829584.1 2265_t:CDS:2 [Entrophospora sp. SA101]CAJ0838954.1 10511_t:CDS:2 [Entrophospora sp. SA101]
MGNSHIEQLLKICKLCGAPSEKVTKMEKIASFNNSLLINYRNYDALAVDLLDKLLVLDPEKKLSVFEALNHEYFQTNPLPANPDYLPKYESSHEYNSHKEKDRRKHHISYCKNDNNYIRQVGWKKWA